MYLLLYLLTVLFPVLFWWWYFAWQDRTDPEPKRLLILVLLGGIAAALLSGLIEVPLLIFFPETELLVPTMVNSSLSMVLIMEMIIVGAVEELSKAYVLNKLIYFKPAFNQIADGFFYGATLALGFSLIENTMYFFQFTGEYEGVVLFVLAAVRGLATTLMHLTATGIVGFGLGRKKYGTDHSPKVARFGLYVAVLLHISFNLLVTLPYGISLGLLLSLSAFMWMFMMTNKYEARLVWKLVEEKRNMNREA